MRKLIMFMGKSGSGKSTLEKYLVDNYPKEFHKVISHTTRDPRIGESDGVDYHFVSRDEYSRMEDNGEYIQKTDFAGNRYASAYSEYKHDKDVCLTVIPKEAKNLKELIEQKGELDLEVIIVFFDISSELIRENMIKRGDDPVAVDARLAKDKLREEFVSTGLTADYTVTDDMLNPDLFDKFKSWINNK